MKLTAQQKSNNKTLQNRIDILQGQIDRCKEPNMFDVSVADQISGWTKLIKKAKKQQVGA